MRTLAFVVILLASTGASARLTQSCNTNFGVGEVYVETSARNALFDIATDPASNPDANYRLYQPSRARLAGAGLFADYVVLEYDLAQDTAEIATSIESDPVLGVMGVRTTFANTATVCFSPPPSPAPATVTEYYNAPLNHYFLSSSELENGIIDAGGAGPGWSRTGEIFQTIQPGACYATLPVFRFYNTHANTHFFTADAAECGFLRRQDPGWYFEGQAFGARLPANGQCAAGETPLYRLYNGRWMFDDSNHRFVSRQDLVDAMAAQGWILEGVALCLPHP
jgi:hypothetical protein